MTKKILIVEDNMLVVEMYRSALKGLDVQLLEARRGEDALRMAEAQTPDLILLDILLPGMSGHETLQRLKANPQTARVPVLAVTTSATAADSSKLKEAGFVGLIPKPINIQSFIDTVARFLP